MTAYAVAHMRHATMDPQIVEYLHRIDATLEPFGGRENDWPGHLIIIRCPMWCSPTGSNIHTRRRMFWNSRRVPDQFSLEAPSCARHSQARSRFCHGRCRRRN